jgi:hypothetical protein
MCLVTVYVGKIFLSPRTISCERDIAALLQLEYLAVLENILRQVITFGILCEMDLNYLPLILQ